MATISRIDYRETSAWCQAGPDRYMVAGINFEGDQIILFGMTAGERLPIGWSEIDPPSKENQQSLTAWVPEIKETADVSLEWF